MDRISEWKRRDEERRRELEEKRKREQEEEIRRLREQEKEEKEKRKEKAEKSEEVHSDSDSSAEDEVAKKGRKGRAKAPSSSDSELELEKEVSAELGTSRQPISNLAGTTGSGRDLPLHWGCPCSTGKGCIHRDIHALHMGALPLAQDTHPAVGAASPRCSPSHHIVFSLLSSRGPGWASAGWEAQEGLWRALGSHTAHGQR